MPFTLMRQQVEIWHAEVVEDSYGQDRRDWTAAALRATGIASVQPSFGTEETVDRQTTVDTWRLYSADPALFGIDATDRVRVNGIDYDIDGPPHLWSHFGRPHHIEAVLRLIKG